MGAVVRVSSKTDLAALGLHPLSPGFARMRGTVEDLLAFADTHPDLPIEVAPPPHLLLNRVGQWTHADTARVDYDVYGDGVLIGVADTGVDFSLADFNDPKTGKTRVQWLIDYSAPFAGIHSDLEQQFGDTTMNVGAVYDADDIAQILGGAGGTVAQSNLEAGLLTDNVGHGSHVTSIAAGNGGDAGVYVGIAPHAGLVVARITGDEGDDISTDYLLSGVAFLYDRAAAMNQPIAVNLSIGSDFGPHDGTMAWEQTLAGYVGPDQPGHALVAAAGNSGDITSEGVHASVYVPPNGSRSIPIACAYGSPDGAGQVQVWVTMRGGAQMSVGLDSPSGTWISPVGANQTGGYPSYDASGAVNADGGAQVSATVVNGSSVSMNQIPAGSNSAIVIWGDGAWSPGTYSVTLTGEGVADLYVEGTGDAVDINGDGVNFVNPVREGTVNIPGTNPGLIAVGCTVNRSSWTSIDNGYVSLGIAPLDGRGGYAVPDASYYLTPSSGKVCWFSSAGPTVTGVQKPEISAPGGLVIAAMSGWATPDNNSTGSIFDNPDCPSVVDGGPSDPNCMVVDTTHAVAAGTSMSAPQAAGTIALLLERDPTLTQDKILGLLQAGAHPFRIADGDTDPDPFEDQGGPGEIDVKGSIDALDQAQDPMLALPALATSWMTLSADELTANGSTPLTAILELRTADGQHRADFFSASRLSAVVEINHTTLSNPSPLLRRAPGVWVFQVTPPPGLGGNTITLGATFDGAPIVAYQTVAIATDVWTANYPSKSIGSCALTLSTRRGPPELAFLGAVPVLARARRRKRRYSDASDTTQPCASRR
jgi:hypothetical protein